MKKREPRGFAFVQFVDPYDAAEAQYHMNRQLFGGREITVVLAAETRKRPEEMRSRARVRGPPSGSGRPSSYYGRSRSRSISRSRSPRYPSASRSRYRSRSYSPAPRRRDDYSVSPRGRNVDHSRSPPRDHLEEREGGPVCRRSYSPGYEGGDHHQADNGYAKKPMYDDAEEGRPDWRSPGRASGSPPGSRSRSADLSPRNSR
ncbi:Serine/arginine-rich SC35-like splicing factor [Thalictrum thalictroides]|uniref:Serine/arginine-rich SC35-like splicing factor n=1 Tax=Thalictrum thalictroides TaxID=46969 RepID=A0A7J6VWP4_THATH|nr:Serine/arginine-rich SC35-like splicing factor [Thalictrum thalictroides]